MKVVMKKADRLRRNLEIKRLHFAMGQSIRWLQKRYGYRSAKSIYNILYPEKYNQYQLKRYHKKKTLVGRG